MNRPNTEICALPAAVSSMDSVSCVAVGGGQQGCTIAIQQCRCYSWGNNYKGRLGQYVHETKTLDTTTNVSSPVAVDAYTRRDALQVACGSEHTLLLNKEGKVYTWGNGCENGQVIGMFSVLLIHTNTFTLHKVLAILRIAAPLTHKLLRLHQSLSCDTWKTY